MLTPKISVNSVARLDSGMPPPVPTKSITQPHEIRTKIRWNYNEGRYTFHRNLSYILILRNAARKQTAQVSYRWSKTQKEPSKYLQRSNSFIKLVRPSFLYNLNYEKRDSKLAATSALANVATTKPSTTIIQNQNSLLFISYF